MTDELPEDPTAVLFRRALAHYVDAFLYLAAFAVSAALLASSTSAPGVDTSSLTDRFDVVDSDLIVYASNNAYTFTASDQLVASAVVLLIALINGVILQGLRGITLGKATLGLRTVRSDGESPGILRAFGREILWIIDGLPTFLIPLVGGFTALLTRGRRRLGDLVGGTFVVGKRFAGEPIAGSDDAQGSTDDDTLSAPAPAMEDLAPAETGTGPVPALDATAGAAAATTLLDPDESETDDLFTEPAPRGPLFGGLDGPAEGAEAAAGPSLFSDPTDQTSESDAPDLTPDDAPDLTPDDAPDLTPDDAAFEAPPAADSEAGVGAAAAASAGSDSEPSGSESSDSEGSGSTASATAPEWDPARKAYIYWEPARQEWLQHDAEADEWVPISRA